MNRMNNEKIRAVHNELLLDLIINYIDQDNRSESYLKWKYGIKNFFTKPSQTVFEDMERLESHGYIVPGKYKVLIDIFSKIHVQAIDDIDKALQKIKELQEDPHGVPNHMKTSQGKTVAQIHIYIINGDSQVASVLALILNTFGSLLDNMNHLTPHKQALNIICRVIMKKQYKTIVQLINKTKLDLKNVCQCEPYPCSPEDILKDFLKFLINVKQEYDVRKWRIGWADGIEILLEFNDKLSYTEQILLKLQKIKQKTMFHFQSILSKSGKLAHGIPKFELRVFLSKELSLSAMDIIIKSPLQQNEEQIVTDHINKENECMDKDDSIIRKILNGLSIFCKVLCCRQVNSIGITIDFPSVADMMHYKYGRTEEIINNEVSDLILESSRCMGHTIDACKLSIEAYYSFGRNTNSDFDITGYLEIEPDDINDTCIAYVDLYTTDIHNRMLNNLVKEFFGENEYSEKYRLRKKTWKDYLEKRCSMTAHQESSILQDFKYLEATTQLEKGEYSVLRNFFNINTRSLRIIDMADQSIEFIKMIYNEDSMQITESQLQTKLATYEIRVHVECSIKQLMDIILDFISELDSGEDSMYPIKVGIEIVETHSIPCDFLDLCVLIDETLSSLSYVISRNLADPLTQSEDILHRGGPTESVDIIHGGSNPCEYILHSILSLLKLFEICQVNRRTFCWGYNCLVIIITLDDTEKFELDLIREAITKTFEGILSVFNNRSEAVEVDCLKASSATEDDDEDEYVESAISNSNPSSHKVLLEN